MHRKIYYPKSKLERGTPWSIRVNFICIYVIWAGYVARIEMTIILLRFDE
jgi:hypothetical protein